MPTLKGIVAYCPVYNVSCILYLLQYMSLFFILRGWIASEQTLYINTYKYIFIYNTHIYIHVINIYIFLYIWSKNILKQQKQIKSYFSNLKVTSVSLHSPSHKGLTGLSTNFLSFN